ncbi:PREDICTED: cytochrome c oxidase subunit 7A-related protein, mitochondrial-like [Rhagoletis zephyria]|uniref:cytochrome c oxidase subunit 7A-related protein, mitochondrial-like n=1 Tax=Rhagoletis zephyria TaxID=28612 RepID=UPI0008112BAA|nr:PREDICTED: cytochrome c oxidase subunit 7A-related protein, mitochondrial-like [Rhagoletis zephyria]
MLALFRPTLIRGSSRCLLAETRRFSASAVGGPEKGGKKSVSCGPSAGPSKKPNPGFEKIKQLQMHFQKNDGKPIHLKGGSRDLMLYRATWGLALLGLLLQFHFFAMYIIY